MFACLNTIAGIFSVGLPKLGLESLHNIPSSLMPTNLFASWAGFLSHMSSYWDKTSEYISHFDFGETVKAFIALFIVIDILGSIPIILDLRQKGRNVNALKATLISYALMLIFLFVGEGMLRLFNVDIASFAVAGAFVIFLMSLEMILDVELFKNQGPIKEATLIPLVFPLLAGAAAFTTLLTLRSQIAGINIIVAVTLNMIWVYFVVSMTEFVEKFIGKGGIYILRKFFGIILLAISVSMFSSNLSSLIENLHTPH